MKGGAWNKKNDKNGMLVLINHILGMHNTVHLNSSVAPRLRGLASHDRREKEQPRITHTMGTRSRDTFLNS